MSRMGKRYKRKFNNQPELETWVKSQNYALLSDAPNRVKVISRKILPRDAASPRVVYNKLLAGWYVVVGPHQTPLNGRFDSKEEAEAWLRKRSGRDRRNRDSNARYERDLRDDEPRIVSGVMGAKSKPFSRRFPNAKAQEHWLESENVAGNVDVYEIKRP